MNGSYSGSSSRVNRTLGDGPYPPRDRAIVLETPIRLRSRTARIPIDPRILRNHGIPNSIERHISPPRKVFIGRIRLISITHGWRRAATSRGYANGRPRSGSRRRLRSPYEPATSRGIRCGRCRPLDTGGRDALGRSHVDPVASRIPSRYRWIYRSPRKYLIRSEPRTGDGWDPDRSSDGRIDRRTAPRFLPRGGTHDE